ncbi:MAG: CBS domain-containing protein [Saprospiraceae bacterium]|nr:CBS domain-containing protein [Saprospiraceae bacterium]MCB9310205.1 CBS domain-containing protein [Lewinellaceae bacterium]
MSLKKKEFVQSIMTKDPITVSTQNKLKDVYNIMKEHSIRHVPVVSGDELIGIISQSDIERVTYVEEGLDEHIRSAFIDMLRIDQVMTRNVNVLQVDDSIKEAAEILSMGSYHALPVLDEKKLVGILTTTDLINYLLKHY